jgi:metal-responsive CopG/Arc/MetJ family transcriptional regulator
MSYDNFSISLPAGYAATMDREAKRSGFNRSELIRVLFEG